MSKVQLDKAEKELVAAYEEDSFESVLTPSRKKQIREMAKATFKKDKRDNTRISSSDADVEH